MISQLDRFLLAFRRDLARAAPHELDYYARLYWDDRHAFYRDQEIAWSSGRAEPYISLSEARALNEELSAKTARRVAHRYLECARFREGSDVIRDPRHQLTQDGPARLELARLELGLGNANAAAVARSQALEFDPSLKGQAAPLGAALAEIGVAEAAAASGGWAETHALADLWIENGSGEAALGVIMTFLTRGQPLARDDQHDFHFALDTVLSLCGPQSAYNLFRALTQQPIYQGRRDVLETICAMLSAPPGEEPAIPEPAALGALGGTAALALDHAGKTGIAITMLGALSQVFHKAHYLRPPLARMIGRECLKTHPLRYGPPGGGRKIFDMVVFNNELRMLKMKLEEMSPWVDTFILIEARQTYTGTPKPLIFQENRDQFAAFADKIVHVVVDEFPSYLQHAWAREYYQRNMGIEGLNGRVREDDLVIISDADELVSRDMVENFEGEYAVMGMERMRYFLNYRQTMPSDALKEYSSVWRAKYLRTMGVGYVRDTIRFDKKGLRLQGGGWHFSSVFDASGIATKLNASSHQEHAGAGVDAIQGQLGRLRAGDYEPGWERWEVDERFPACVRGRRRELEDIIL